MRIYIYVNKIIYTQMNRNMRSHPHKYKYMNTVCVYISMRRVIKNNKYVYLYILIYMHTYNLI